MRVFVRARAFLMLDFSISRVPRICFQCFKEENGDPYDFFISLFRLGYILRVVGSFLRINEICICSILMQMCSLKIYALHV